MRAVKKNNGYGAHPADMFAQFETVDIRQTDIENDQIDLAGPDLIQGFVAGGRQDRGEAFGLEGILKRIGNGRFVLDDEYFRWAVQWPTSPVKRRHWRRYRPRRPSMGSQLPDPPSHRPDHRHRRKNRQAISPEALHGRSKQQIDGRYTDNPGQVPHQRQPGRRVGSRWEPFPVKAPAITTYYGMQAFKKQPQSTQIDTCAGQEDGAGRVAARPNGCRLHTGWRRR